MRTIILSLLFSTVCNAQVSSINIPTSNPALIPSYSWLLQKCGDLPTTSLKQECLLALKNTLPSLANPERINPRYPIADFFEDNYPQILPQLDNTLEDITGREDEDYPEIKEEDYPKFN